VRGFRGGGGPACGPDFPPVSAQFGWDRAKEAPFWPDLGSSLPSTARSGSRLVGFVLVAVFAQIFRNWLLLHAVGVNAPRSSMPSR
jgi:hypothetical protein